MQGKGLDCADRPSIVAVFEQNIWQLLQLSDATLEFVFAALLQMLSAGAQFPSFPR
jgi:hypothetical protein